LALWIQDFDGNDPALENVANEQQLTALLQVGAGWIAQERAALQELETSVRQATAVLAERRAQREQHERLREDAAPLDAGLDGGPADASPDDLARPLARTHAQADGQADGQAATQADAQESGQ